jgi:Arc/MetJ-type ribon-helix-helix transcriptional regulator
MKMRETPENVQIRLSADLMRRIDELRAAQPVVPSRSETIRYLIERAIAAEEAEAREPREKLALEAAEAPGPQPLSEQGERRDGPSPAAAAALRDRQ